MKCFQKINKILLFAVMFLFLGTNALCGHRTYLNIDGIKFSFVNKKDLERQASEVKSSLAHRLAENPKNIPYIITGGKYLSVPHTNGYESHHLISAAFCRKYPGIIEAKNAPAVLILKQLHFLTGSYGGKSEAYLKKEEEAYKNGGIEAVLKLGVNDLYSAIESYIVKYYLDVSTSTMPNSQHIENSKKLLPPSPNKFSPIKHAYEALPLYKSHENQSEFNVLKYPVYYY